MESEARPVIVPKTQEQLKQQTNQVNIQRSLNYSKPLPVEVVSNQPGFKIGLKGYRAYVKEWHKEHDQNIPPRPDPWTKIYREYEEYLQALRTVRKSQVGYLSEQVKPKPEGISQREAYLEVAKYSPDLAKRVLGEINGTVVGGGEPYFFKVDEIKVASSSENTFFAAVDKALSRKPEVIYEVFDQLNYALPKEKIREAVIKAGVHYRFLAYYPYLKDLFTPEEQRTFIAPLMYEGIHGLSVVEFFKDPDAVKLFSPDEVKKAVMIGFENNVIPSLMKDQIIFFMEQGILIPQDVETILLERVRDFKSFEKLADIATLLPNTQSLNKIKAEIIDTYANRAKLEDLGNISSTGQLLTPEQKLYVVKTAVLRDKFQTGFPVGACERLITPELFAPILKEVIYSPDIPLNGSGVEEILKARGLTEEEKEAFIDYLLANGEGRLLLEGADNNLFQFRDEGKRDEVARKIFNGCKPGEVVKSYKRHEWDTGWGSAVSSKLLKDLIASSSLKNAEVWLGKLDIWTLRFVKNDTAFITNFLEKYRETNAESMFYKLDEVVRFLPDNRVREFVIDLVHANPIDALVILQEPDVFTKVGVNISPAQIIETATSDTERLSFAPKTLREFYKQYSSTTPIEKQKALLIEAYNIYKAIAFIKGHGLEAGFRRVQASKDTSIGEEEDLISTFYCFALLKESNPEQFAQIGNLGNSLEESKQILFNQFSQLLGLNKQLSPEEVGSFFGTMETPVPFMTYLLQYKDAPKHRKLLTEIFNSITAGTFNEWKYGPTTPEAFEALKQAKLIPAKLTLEQYAIWRTDGQTTLFESLATDTETTADAIRDYLEGNLDHLEVKDILDYLMEAYPNQDLMEGLQIELASLGQQLATNNKDLSILRKQALPTNTQRITELEQIKAASENKRRILLRTRKIFRLINIKPNEVAAGYFLEGKDSKQRGDSIAKVLDELRGSSAEDNGFIYDQLDNMLNSLKSTSEKQNLTAADSSDPKVWIEIGEEPVASCQSYNSGSHNDCLIGYTDPNTKILVLRNQKGKIIARSIFRLLETSDGNSALHIERVYSSSTSKGVLRSMFARAYQKAEEMGLPLLISEQSQDTGGIDKEAQLAEGYQLKGVDYTLHSKASRAPKVYVDSAGGVSSDGEFEMKNLAQIQKVN